MTSLPFNSACGTRKLSLAGSHGDTPPTLRTRCDPSHTGDRLPGRCGTSPVSSSSSSSLASWLSRLDVATGRRRAALEEYTPDLLVLGLVEVGPTEAMHPSFAGVTFKAFLIPPHIIGYMSP